MLQIFKSSITVSKYQYHSMKFQNRAKSCTFFHYSEEQVKSQRRFINISRTLLRDISKSLQKFHANNHNSINLAQSKQRNKSIFNSQIQKNHRASDKREPHIELEKIWRRKNEMKSLPPKKIFSDKIQNQNAEQKVLNKKVKKFKIQERIYQEQKITQFEAMGKNVRNKISCQEQIEQMKLKLSKIQKKLSEGVLDKQNVQSQFPQQQVLNLCQAKTLFQNLDKKVDQILQQISEMSKRIHGGQEMKNRDTYKKLQICGKIMREFANQLRSLNSQKRP